MNLDEFCAHYDHAMEEAMRLYSASAQGQSVISNGMDDACEEFIFSPNYIDDNADEVAAAAVAAIDSDFAPDAK